MCRPIILDPNKDGCNPILEVYQSRHPCVFQAKGFFIPNDIKLEEGVMLLTGPNMGGKSTILRQSCILTILAQIGCYVPAMACKLSLVDRIFTRLGASDRLCTGKSTFYIEMEETLNILRYATRNSLVIIDELGRGTSTFDGISIAYSVLRYLAFTIQCRSLFATHYRSLLDNFRNEKNISLYHMASEIDPQNGKITFLYKLVPGESSSSFGLNVANLAGISKDILNIARIKRDEMDHKIKSQKLQFLDKQFLEVVKVLNKNLEVDTSLKLLSKDLNQLKLVLGLYPK